jgi:hypothetical protein
MLRSTKLFPTQGTNSTQLTILERTTTRLKLLIIKMTLTAAALNLCHTVNWNFYRTRLPDGTPLCRKVCSVCNIVFGILYSAVNYSQYTNCSLYC